MKTLAFPDYPGTKGGAGVFQNIISLMPPHDAYIETHLGMGYVMRNKKPAAENIGLEKDPAIVAIWRQQLVTLETAPIPLVLCRDSTEWIENFEPIP